MGQLPSSAFQAYDPSNESSIQPGPFALYSVSMNEGFAEVDSKISGWNLVDPSDLQSTLLTDIEPVVIGPGWQALPAQRAPHLHVADRVQLRRQRSERLRQRCRQLFEPDHQRVLDPDAGGQPGAAA
jgi:hypothetical protein